jgi:hypothetical protein
MMKLSLIVLLSMGAADGFVTPGLFLLHRKLSSADERCVCVRALFLCWFLDVVPLLVG